jgi:hypothetical protein
VGWRPWAAAGGPPTSSPPSTWPPPSATGCGPYGSQARQSLTELAFGKSVRAAAQDTDRYGRAVGRVFAGLQDINADMVRHGAAWVYRRYSDDPALLRIEQAARTELRGLWGLPETERVPPWEWRTMRRHDRNQNPSAVTRPFGATILVSGALGRSEKKPIHVRNKTERR